MLRVSQGGVGVGWWALLRGCFLFRLAAAANGRRCFLAGVSFSPPMLGLLPGCDAWVSLHTPCVSWCSEVGVVGLGVRGACGAGKLPVLPGRILY